MRLSPPSSSFFFFFLLLPPPPSPTLFPYTTLFRSDSVIVVHEKTADAPERIAEGQRCRADLGRESWGDAPPPAVQENAGRRAEEAAVPDESAAAKQHVRVAQEHVPQLGAHQSADDAGDDDVGGIVFVEPARAQIELNRPP